ncbi:MAG: sulfatase-like hydrolase/transferase [Akkermansiaceae bacterium]
MSPNLFFLLSLLCVPLAASQPNILLIMADDMGRETLGAHGGKSYRTPVLDKLASQGLSFDHCYSLPICTPSRVKLMTGKYSFRNYISFGTLDPSEKTFGNALQKAGYQTCIAGKWQLGGDHNQIKAFGWDEYILQNKVQPIDKKAKPLWEGRERYWSCNNIIANGKYYQTDKRYGPDIINEYAVNFIKRDHKKPFFLYYPMILPHSPWAPTPHSKTGDKTGAQVSEVQYFKDNIEYIDHLVGNLLNALDQSGQRENTIVMFTGDNGSGYPVGVTASNPHLRRVGSTSRWSNYKEILLEPGEKTPTTLKRGTITVQEGPLTETDYGDVPGRKNRMLRDGTGVPCVMDWPMFRRAYDKTGHRHNDLIDFSDFFATILEVAGTEVDYAIDGISFAPRLRGEAKHKREFIFCHYWAAGRDPKKARDAIHDSKYKLYNDGRFYDITKDSDELKPLDPKNASPEATAAHSHLKNHYKKVRGFTPNIKVAPSKRFPTKPETSAPPRQPNVVLIYSDDQGYGDVGYHGYKDILTPNIDRLAKEGTSFSQGYVSASVCGPSRCGLLTGVYQQRLGVYGNYDKGGVPTTQPLIFELLKKQGYQTGAVGKWHVGGATDDLHPNNRGVEFFYGFLFGAHDYYRSSTNPNFKKKSEWPILRNEQIEPPIQDSRGYLTEMFTREAVDFIEKASPDKPLFLYLAYNAVHHPWDVPQPYLDRVAHLDTHDERKLFAGMVLALDDGVGAVMKALEKKGIADDTLVIFMSDNGSPRGQGIKQPKQKKRGQCTMSNPGPFNGFKGDTYEGGIRVPMVMRWPDHIPARTSYPHPVLNLDLVSTIMARSNVTKPHKGLDFDGVDLLPHLDGSNPARPHETLYWRRGDDYAIRKGDWKLAWNDQASSGQIELFDLKNDPGEWKNLASTNSKKAQELQDLFDTWDSALPDNQGGKNPKNRNSKFAEGHRIKVAEFNSAISPPEPRGPGRSLKEQLTQSKARAAKSGKKFDPQRTTRWFNAKDLNKDGALDKKELATKAPVDWNQ